MTKLTFKNYSNQALETIINRGEHQLSIYVMGLCGEAGEVAEKFKKLLRDNDVQITAEFKSSVQKELGDVLWYINAIANQLDIPLEDVAQGNIDKITSRKNRGVQSGCGDNR